MSDMDDFRRPSDLQREDEDAVFDRWRDEHGPEWDEMLGRKPAPAEAPK
jgi:hypothetical protein